MLIDYTDKIRNYIPRKSSITKIVLHNTDGTAKSAVNWFMDPASKVSAHYIIDRGGTILKCVDEYNTAWHAGNNIINQCSIGIEIEAYQASPNMTAEQEKVLVELIKELMIKYKITPENIGLHRFYKATKCPAYTFKTDEEFFRWRLNHF